MHALPNLALGSSEQLHKGSIHMASDNVDQCIYQMMNIGFQK